jgi:hypothetical protein
MLMLKPIQASARPLMFLHQECLHSRLSLQGKSQAAATVIAEGCGWKCCKAQKVGLLKCYCAIGACADGHFDATQGKGRPVGTNYHHVAMPGCFTQFYTKPKVPNPLCLPRNKAEHLSLPTVRAATMPLVPQSCLQVILALQSLHPQS